MIMYVLQLGTQRYGQYVYSQVDDEQHHTL